MTNYFDSSRIELHLSNKILSLNFMNEKNIIMKFYGIELYIIFLYQNAPKTIFYSVGNLHQTE